MSALSKAVSQILSKPASSPDGLTAGESGSAVQGKSGLVGDLLFQAKNGTLGHAARTITEGLVQMPSAENPLDDRKLLLEHGVSLLQHLPSNSSTGQKISEDFIGMLWNDLPHPPASYVGPQATYRAPDGSGNNPLLPTLGQAGTPYARSVAPVRPKPSALPDPGLVFDMLLRRDDKEFKPHPSGISSLFFSFATIVIHECFQTSGKDWWINETSSYVDLSTLYGNNATEQDSVRTLNGHGTLHNDTIASARLMMMPPAVIVILIIFSRNHNSIAQKLLEINEKGTYTSPPPTDPVKLRKQDDDIFNKARNVNVAWFAHIVLGDYVATILNTPRAGSEWGLDLGAEIRNKDGTRLSRGGGNAVSVEFNVAYHWHASMSQHDASWIGATFEKLFPGVDVAKLTPQEFYQGAGKRGAVLAATPPKDWTMHGLQRGADGRYPDTVLAEILNDAIDAPAHAFGAHGSPACLRVVEILGQNRARDAWGVCTMNEFRKYLNLKPFETFEEWNPDPKVAEAFNTSTLTSWGVSSIKKTPGSPCGLFPGLIFNALPLAYKFNSTYALLPFYTPQAAKEIFTGRGTINNDSIKLITGGRGFMIGFDDKARHDPPSTRMMAAFHQPNFEAETASFFSRHADYQIKKSSLAYANSTTRQLDIVRDVANVVAIEWIANRFALPVKRPETPRGLLSIAELRMMFLGLFVFSSFNIIPKNGWLLRETSLKSNAVLAGLIKTRINTASGWKDAALDFMSSGTAYEDSDESERFYKALQATGADADQLAGDCLGVAIPIAGNLTQQTSLLVELFLRDEYSEDKAKIAQLVQTESPANDELLAGYIREGMRISGVVLGLPRVARVDMTIQDGDRTLHFKAGDKLVIGISKAHMDPVAFPGPEKLNPTRPKSDYILLGHGMHYCFGARLTETGLLATIKTIFKLKNLRRAPGRAGSFIRISENFAQGLETHLYLDQNSGETPAPVSLHVLYDAETIDSPTGDEAVKDIQLKLFKTNKPSPVATPPPTPPMASTDKMQRRRSSLFDLKRFGSVRRKSAVEKA
ncbi:hypothetical protein RQP46_010737 [Phenoliferia psychrophenolica]